jgi:hypothetical protein
MSCFSGARSKPQPLTFVRLYHMQTFIYMITHMVKNHSAGGLASPTLPTRFPVERSQVQNPQTPIFYQNQQANTWVPRGNPCLGHVAPCHLPKTLSLVSTRLDHVCYPVSKQPCQYTCHVSYLPHHLYGCAMFHPCSGDTCHPHIGPPVMSTSASVRPVTLPRVSPYAQSLYGKLPRVTSKLPTVPSMSFVRSYNLYSQLPRGFVWTVQSTFFCLFGKMNKSP